MGALAMCKMLESGDLEGAAGLLDAEPTLMEQVGPDGTRSTPLIRTARAGQLELVKFLVRRGANMHAISSRGQTALHCAAEEGHEEVAAYLLDNGAQPSYQDTDGMTPLMSATKRRHIGMALLLLDYMGGEGLEAVDGLGRTVLHWAICGGGHEEVMAHLINHGARGDIRDNKGETAVEMAVRRGYVGATELLIGHMRPEALQQRDGTGRNLLDTAIDHYLHDMVVCLVSKGLPFAARDNSGTTALMYCARHCSVVQMRRLLEHTAGQGLNDRSSDGKTALHYAVLYYRPENVRALLLAGADPTIVDDLQKTPRMLAQQGTAHRSSGDIFKWWDGEFERGSLLYRCRSLDDAYSTHRALPTHTVPGYLEARVKAGLSLPRVEVLARQQHGRGRRLKKRCIMALSTEEQQGINPMLGYVIKDLSKELFTELMQAFHA